jgi:hypothetical protein
MTEDQATPSKNPGRVAWGKKLAMMSKELKEKKKAQLGPSRTEPRPSKGQIEELLQKDIKIDTETKSTLDLHRIEVLVGIGGLALAAVALYLNYKSVPSDPRSVLLEPSRIEPSRIEPSRIEPRNDQSKTTCQSKLGPGLILPGPSEQYDYRNF